MHQPAFSGMDSLEFPELHEDSVGVLAFSRNLYKMMRASGVHDFSLKVRDAQEWPVTSEVSKVCA